MTQSTRIPAATLPAVPKARASRQPRSAAPVLLGPPWYGRYLDSDGDGIGCE
ncbi:excalibur calcium-binding domain-containing protein [Brevundimonas lenta]|uniref:excalibur calcium-binding domain-containing protein n=1 Tax=Brevundimonas lenta TaxID=424796 RepID=UPI00160693CC